MDKGGQIDRGMWVDCSDGGIQECICGSHGFGWGGSILIFNYPFYHKGAGIGNMVEKIKEQLKRGNAEVANNY